MTDKVQKIREEVERIQLYTQSEVLKQVLDCIDEVQKEEIPPKFPLISQKKCMYTKDDFTDEDRKVLCDGCEEECEYSKKEEPVSEDLNTESMIESYKQRLISQANGMKNSPLVDMCLASYKHGINETLDTLNLSNVQRTVKNWEEPVSDDLEEAAEDYAATGEILPNGKEMISFDALKAFKAGAKWQKEKDQEIIETAIHHAYHNGRLEMKEQMMKNTADAMIGVPYENKDGGYTHIIDVSRPLPVGNNKIAIIFKED